MRLGDQARWHRASVTVQVADTDYGGGVYHGRYFNLYNQARDLFLEEIGAPYRSLMDQGINLSVAEAHTAFLLPVFYGDQLEVRTRVFWLRSKSLGVIQEMWGRSPKESSQTLRNRMEIHLVATSQNRAVPLPAHLLTALKSFYGL